MRLRLRLVPCLLSVLAALPVGAEESVENVLAVTWLPAFCERHGRRPECRAIARDPTLGWARQFTAHGLWPQPRERIYCGVGAEEARRDRDGRWDALPRPGMDRETAEGLVDSMPGVAVHLHRHQWVKHGRCYGAPSADAYFDDLIWLMAALNGSAVAELFRERAGRVVTAAEIRRAFDRSFGEGAGARVSVRCREGRVEALRLRLSGPIHAGSSDLGALLRATAPVGRGDCRAGLVDAPG